MIPNYRDQCFFVSDSQYAVDEALYRASKYRPEQRVAFMERCARAIKDEVERMKNEPGYVEMNT